MILNYQKLISRAVCRKWNNNELRQTWFGKFTMVRRKKLEKLFIELKGRCVFCDCETWIALPSDPEAGVGKYKFSRATVEHIIPQSAGGTDNMRNLTLSCMACNSYRGVEDFDLFKEVRSDPIKWKNYRRQKATKSRQANNDRIAKSQERRIKLIWNLGILFYLHTSSG